MYKSYKLVKFVVNMSDNASSTVTELAMSEDKAMMKMYDEMSKVGGNEQTKNIRCMLFNPNGDLIKVEELIKSTEPTVTE